jgi:hypothetical protein
MKLPEHWPLCQNIRVKDGQLCNAPAMALSIPPGYGGYRHFVCGNHARSCALIIPLGQPVTHSSIARNNRKKIVLTL